MAIRDVSDTALWAAVFRARESERADALFRDPYAHRLAGSRGEQIMTEVAHAGDNDWAWVMRTYLFDRVIREELQQGTDMVLNLAAGLDARPYRMELPPHLDWVEMDLPRIFAYKNEILRDERPLCRLEQVSVDLSDPEARRAAFARAMTGHSRVLVLSEGLLIYLTAPQVGELARDLAAAGAATWIMDLPSPGLLTMLQKTTGQATERAGAPLQFGPREGPAYFEQFGWRPTAALSVFTAAIDTNRVPPELAAFQNFPQPQPPFGESEIWSGVCVFQRA
ncbi:MAG TPA: SAM-dependent methyltransferase [Candidatus Limnocylindrales bacterium]|nr:SAM-dependent methyltransferase [Candidatus Limnocylindrales bacterium]